MHFQPMAELQNALQTPIKQASAGLWKIPMHIPGFNAVCSNTILSIVQRILIVN